MKGSASRGGGAAPRAVRPETERSGVGGRTARRKFSRGQVVEAAVWPLGVVLGTPALDQVAGLLQADEELPVA